MNTIKKGLQWLNYGAKAAVAGSGAAILAVDQASADGIVTDSEWFDIGVAVATVLAVYLKKNGERPA